MNIILYTSSTSLQNHLRAKLNISFEVRADLAQRVENNQLHLLHLGCYKKDGLDWVRNQASRGATIAVCSDMPELAQMLESVQAGCKAYCNSYMQPGLYQQMFAALEAGQSWFPPEMLAQTFTLAQAALGVGSPPAQLQALTEREKEVAHAVAEGLSNRQIAQRCNISERTVKAHLTSIFKKLDIKDRVALVLQFK
jgi:DNA-binding NarL/FixJ family response regulator